MVVVLKSCVGSTQQVDRADASTSRRITMHIEGGCLCGSIRYTCDAEPALTANCHCKHCQRQSGSAFSTIIGVP